MKKGFDYVIQRGYRVLFLWVIWLTITLVMYLGLYQDTEVWEFVQNDPSRITWVILILFVFGVIVSFALTIILTLETTHVDALELIIKKSGWSGIQSVPKRLGLRRFFESVILIMEKNADVNIEALIDVEFALYQRIAHALEIIGNLLITLGLIGTVVGLTLTLTGLTSSLEALGQDQDQLMSGLQSAMAGMGTAFYTTLLGSVLGGVLLRVFAHINQSGVENLEETLTRICLVHFSADLKPSVTRDVRLLNLEIENLTTNIERLQSSIVHSNASIAEFTKELTRFRSSQNKHDSIDKTLQMQREYNALLHEEIQLKRLRKGWWWKLLLENLRRR